MSSPGNTIASRIAMLEDHQVVLALQQLLLEVDPEPAVMEDELEQRAVADETLLREIAAALHVEGTQEADPRIVLVTVADEVPDLQPAMAAAITAASRDNTTLDAGMTLAVGLIVVALAGAILRPRVTRNSRELRDENGRTEVEKTLTAEVRGIDDPTTLLKALIPFL
jgi:hypothetical protein